jgi:ABC-type polysaccharide/polyol phosphate export permease/protein involved in temperature-dependent protein secretion
MREAAEARLQAGDIAGALALAREAAAADPSDMRNLRLLSGILEAAGERQQAIATAEAAVRLDPADAELRLHLGSLMAADRRWRDAAEQLAVHVASGTAGPAGWALLSSALHQAGATERAADAIRNAIAGDPGNTGYRLHLASLLCAAGLYEHALAELQEASVRSPDEPMTWRIQSGIHEALGQLPEALGAAERAALLAGGDPACQEHLAHIARLCNVPAPGDAAAWRAAPARARAVAPPTAPTLAENAGKRWRVIYAIMLRDIRTRFGHTQLGYLWAIIEPIGHLATLGAMFYALNHAPPPVGDNMFLFYVTGLLPFLMFSHVSNDVMGAVEGSHAMLQLPIVRRTDMMAAHALRQLATEAVVGIVIFSVAALLGEQGMPADLLTAGEAIALLWLLAVGTGAVNVVLQEALPAWDTFYAALIRMLYFTSGIYYSPVGMPDWVREVLLWNPVLQGIDLFRGGFFRQYEPHWLDLDYLAAWAAGSVGVGFALERATRARLAIRT